MDSYPLPYISHDTNCLNSKGRIPELNQLQDWADQELIDYGSGETLWDELPQGHGSLREAACATGFRGGDLTPQQNSQYDQFRQTLFPSIQQLTDQQDADLRHLLNHLECQNSHWAFFVTNDHHFLDRKEELSSQGILVGTPKDCISWLRPILPKILKWIEKETPSNKPMQATLNGAPDG